MTCLFVLFPALTMMSVLLKRSYIIHYSNFLTNILEILALAFSCFIILNHIHARKHVKVTPAASFRHCLVAVKSSGEGVRGVSGYFSLWWLRGGSYLQCANVVQGPPHVFKEFQVTAEHLHFSILEKLNYCCIIKT